MPMTRFELRNEFSLADSELYRAADKDDPEALLEGVAMAGLVGLLRQLGDLAEFAAEIFHNLHEEVMVTAARGHSLMTRVRQLETEVPSIERAFLSQTDHSSFFYLAGVDWHPNLRTETNLVTREDLPRFVMDSYEECRAPPRLFLLDKFDIAGAGACLKRYTDPSFFKVETADMTNADVQRERKILNLKKKVPRWRNGEMTEPSNTKLHQLFMEECTENGVNNLRRVKLKRRLNGFPFDSKTGESYMKKILMSPSPDHKALHEVDVYPLSALIPARSDENESGLESIQVRPASPDRVSVERERSLHPSPERKEILLNSSICEPAEATADDQIGEVSNSYHRFVTGSTSSTLDEVTAEKVTAIDAENNSGGSLTSYESNVVASEGETYMDATSVMEPEMDTEPEFSMKNDLTTLHTKSRSSISDANEEHDPTWISDCQSSGDSLLSDEGNNSSRKEMSGCSTSDSANRILSADTPKMEVVASPSFQNDADEGFMVDQLSQTVASTDGINCHTSDFGQQQTNLCSNESMPTLVHLELEVIETENKSKQPEYNNISSTSHDDESKTNIVTDQQCYPFVSDFEFHSRDNSAGLSAGEHLAIEPKKAEQPEYDEKASTSDEDEKKTHLITDQPSYPVVSDYELYSRENSAVLSAGQYLVNEPKDEMVPCTSTVPDINRPIADSSATSLDLLHEDEADQQEQYLVGNEASTSNIFSVPSQSRNDAPQIIPTTHPIPCETGDEIPKLLENLFSDYPDVPHNEDVIKPTVSQEQNQLYELDSEDSNASANALNHSSGLMEVPSGQKLNGTLLVSSQTVDSEENFSNGSAENLIRSENMILRLGNSPDWPQADLGAAEDVNREQGMMGNETSAVESPTSDEIVRLPGEVKRDCVFLGEPAEASDAVERDEINLHKSSTAEEVTGFSGSTDLKPPNGPDSGAGISNVDMASTVSVLTDDTIVDNAHSNMDLNKVVEEHVYNPEVSGLVELENDENSLSVSHGEFAGLVEEAVQTEAAAPDSEATCNRTNEDHPKLEVSVSVPNSLLDFKVDNRWGFADCITRTPVLEPRGSVAVGEPFQQSGLGNDVPDAKSLSGDNNTEESKMKQKAELPPNELDQELSHSGEISSELPSLLFISHEKLQDHDDQKRENCSFPTVSLAGCPNPPSISELQGQNDCDVGVSGYSRAPLGSLFSPNNPFTERNQISLADLPPLPPLPPVQWRMGKSQQDSAPMEGGMIKHKELSPELVSPMIASTDDVSSSWVNSSTDDFKTLPPTASAADVNSFLQIASSTDDIKNFPLTASSKDGVTSQTASSTDDVKTSPPTASAADVNTSPQIASSSYDIKNLQLMTSSDDVISPQAASSPDGAKIFPLIASANDVSTSPKVASSTDDISSSPLTTSNNYVSLPLEEATHCPIQTAPMPELKEEAAESNCSTQEIEDMQVTANIVSNIEEKQQQPAVHTPKIEFTSPEEDDGLSHESRTMKLPRPRNPLVDEVASLKLRKVSNRDRPQIQKGDERDAFLEQIRNKSFHLKPTMASRPTIQHPKTNIRVAAILEKANAIRQALAGSDEDDDDCWNDS